MDNGGHPGCAALKPIQHTLTHGHDYLRATVYHSPVSLAPGASSRPLPLVQYLFHLRQHRLYLGQPEGHLHGAIHLHGGGQRSTGLLLLACLGVQHAEAAVAVRLERAHAQFLGQDESLLVTA